MEEQEKQKYYIGKMCKHDVISFIINGVWNRIKIEHNFTKDLRGAIYQVDIENNNHKMM